MQDATVANTASAEPLLLEARPHPRIALLTLNTPATRNALSR